MPALIGIEGDVLAIIDGAIEISRTDIFTE
jgi:hypothetical protein